MKKASVIYVDGGNTFYLQRHIIQSSFWKAVNPFLDKGQCVGCVRISFVCVINYLKISIQHYLSSSYIMSSETMAQMYGNYTDVTNNDIVYYLLIQRNLKIGISFRIQFYVEFYDLIRF